MTINYAKIPLLTMEKLQEWVEHGRPPGEFLRAVIENKLIEAFKHADEANTEAMQNIVAWVHNETPYLSHGSPENVDGWELKKRLERLKAQG